MVSVSPFQNRLISILEKILRKSLRKYSKKSTPKSLKKKVEELKFRTLKLYPNKKIWYNDQQFIDAVFNDLDSFYYDSPENFTTASPAAAPVTVDIDPLVNETLSDIQIINTVDVDALVNDTLSDVQINNTVDVDALVNDTLSEVKIENNVGVDALVNETLSEVNIQNNVGVVALVNETLSEVKIENRVEVKALVNEILSEVKINNNVAVDALVNDTLSVVKIENHVEVEPLVNETLSGVEIVNNVEIKPLVNDTLSQINIVQVKELIINKNKYTTISGINYLNVLTSEGTKPILLIEPDPDTTKTDGCQKLLEDLKAPELKASIIEIPELDKINRIVTPITKEDDYFNFIFDIWQLLIDLNRTINDETVKKFETIINDKNQELVKQFDDNANFNKTIVTMNLLHQDKNIFSEFIIKIRKKMRMLFDTASKIKSTDPKLKAQKQNELNTLKSKVEIGDDLKLSVYIAYIVYYYYILRMIINEQKKNENKIIVVILSSQNDQYDNYKPKIIKNAFFNNPIIEYTSSMLQPKYEFDKNIHFLLKNLYSYEKKMDNPKKEPTEPCFQIQDNVNIDSILQESDKAKQKEADEIAERSRQQQLKAEERKEEEKQRRILQAADALSVAREKNMFGDVRRNFENNFDTLTVDAKNVHTLEIDTISFADNKILPNDVVWFMKWSLNHFMSMIAFGNADIKFIVYIGGVPMKKYEDTYTHSEPQEVQILKKNIWPDNDTSIKKKILIEWDNKHSNFNPKNIEYSHSPTDWLK